MENIEAIQLLNRSREFLWNLLNDIGPCNCYAPYYQCVHEEAHSLLEEIKEHQRLAKD
jgi:hypothetical protein